MALKIGSLNLKRLKLENIYNAYFGMDPREQTFALVGAVVALVLVVILPVVVASSRISRLEREVASGKEQFRDVMRSIDSYNARKGELTGLQQALSGGYDNSISTTIESLAERHGMKDQIDSLKAKAVAPSEVYEESAVDIRLKRVALDPLIKFIYDIENDPNKLLRVKTLNIKPRFDSKSQLDVSLTVSTYRLIEGAMEGI